jgi:metal-responsive CopG/Arc/MetJ family transcriptional regulator
MVVIARKQTLVQLSEELLTLLDREAARRNVSRSALIREAIEQHLDAERRAEIGRQIVEGYRRIPETEEEMAWAEASAREMLEEESW